MSSLLHLYRRVFALIHLRLRVAQLDPVMIAFTRAGTKGAIWILIALLVSLFGVGGGFQTGVMTVAALLMAEGVTNLLLKPSVRRQRPFASHATGKLLVGRPGANSWPSAHASSSMAAAAALSFQIPMFSPIFVLLALLIGYSRVYVGVHYPIDVLAGFLQGLLCAAITVLAAHLIL
ncbi:MAG: phosphatase PAP2 family protein [Chloroflexota bacterium]